MIDIILPKPLIFCKLLKELTDYLRTPCPIKANGSQLNRIDAVCATIISVSKISYEQADHHFLHTFVNHVNKRYKLHPRIHGRG